MWRLFLISNITLWKWGGERELYPIYVKVPGMVEELIVHQKKCSAVGFLRCIGFSDTSHVVTECCEYRLRQLYLGYKLAHTTRTYNITVNCIQHILNTTCGHPARFNDKTLVFLINLFWNWKMVPMMIHIPLNCWIIMEMVTWSKWNIMVVMS